MGAAPGTGHAPGTAPAPSHQLDPWPSAMRLMHPPPNTHMLHWRRCASRYGTPTQPPLSPLCLLALLHFPAPSRLLPHSEPHSDCVWMGKLRYRAVLQLPSSGSTSGKARNGTTGQHCSPGFSDAGRSSMEERGGFIAVPSIRWTKAPHYPQLVKPCIPDPGKAEGSREGQRVGLAISSQPC